jgi:hypothetical protein
LNPGRRGEKPATNRLSYGAAFGKDYFGSLPKESVVAYIEVRRVPWKNCANLSAEISTWDTFHSPLYITSY